MLALGAEPEAGLEGEYRYEFLLALTSAIELFGAQALARDGRAFNYRGANLRYAVERHLYYEFLAERVLRRVFRECFLAGRDPAPAMAQAIDAALTSRRVKRGTGIIANLRRLMRHMRPRPVAPMPDRTTGDFVPEVRPQVLFVVIHERFARFLAPLSHAFELPYAYLTPTDPALRDALVSNGMPVVYASSIDRVRWVPSGLGGLEFLAAHYDAFAAVLSRLRPKCIVLPEGGAPLYEVIHRAGDRLAIPTMCVQQGWSPYLHPGFRHMSYTAMAVWGERFGEMLRPTNPDQRFTVTGNYMIEFPPVDGGSGDAIVFFFSGSRKAAHFDTLTTAEMYGGFLDLVRWTAERFPTIPVLVRDHPQLPLAPEELKLLAGLPNVRYVPPRDFTLAAILSQACLSIAIYSTTILESVAAGVVPLIVNVTSMPRYWPDLATEGVAIEVKSFEKARLTIAHAVEDPMYLDPHRRAIADVRRRYFARAAAGAVAATVDEIRKICATSTPVA